MTREDELEAKKFSLSLMAQALYQVIGQRLESLTVVSAVATAGVSIVLTINSERFHNIFLAYASIVVLAVVSLMALGRFIWISRKDAIYLASGIEEMSSSDLHAPRVAVQYRRDYWPEVLFLCLVIGEVLFAFSFVNFGFGVNESIVQNNGATAISVDGFASSTVSRIAHTHEELCLPSVFSSSSEAEKSYNGQMAKDEFVIHLRRALDAYLSNGYATCDKDGCVNGRVGSKHYPDSAVEDLQKLELNYATYFKSKFIVLQTDVAPGGGESIVLVFKDRPDTVFYAWVYDYGDGYDLRGFKEYGHESGGSENIQQIQKTYVNQLCDEEMGI